MRNLSKARLLHLCTCRFPNSTNSAMNNDLNYTVDIFGKNVRTLFVIKVCGC